MRETIARIALYEKSVLSKDNEILKHDDQRTE